ncbi:flagellar biosynthesis protein FlhF [Lederbergia lenta]|uniref:Flagellar biosynthesis protein FlhF n=1 Tax=Lederbergia lenta TaxID=1467 RepID=A0A2X4W7P3_LEDLE|nr:flagellar biosynthesis protein FlhF [Lederbergia lenta]MEC2324296.1 flagellar biosynthesis protein FlhF [Lederbergia lenta]SQI60216.1 GTP-binding signal recognition particle SRP54 G-domain-containing protein [Lederbergia lenta]
MNIKKIIAPSMPAAMKKVKDELGDNAVILNSKVVYHGGFLGMFRKKKIEVIAALDEIAVQPKQKTKVKKRKLPDNSHTETIKKETKHVESIARSNRENRDIMSEMAEIKRELTSVRHHHLNIQSYPEYIQSCLLQLHEAELNEKYVQELGDIMLEKWRNASSQPTKQDVISWCNEIIVDQLTTFNFEGIDYSKKYINLVGPTGVGKTTTIAKLAAEAMLEQNKRVAFITLDTYRIAAIEQLKTYAQLLNIPIEVVYKQEDFSAAMDKFADFDLVLIDTAGRNYRELVFVDELKNTFNEVNMATFLVLSISMREKDMGEIVENFQQLNIDQFIFTKIDETQSYGAMFNLIKKYEKGVAYITTGQDVPDDILTASPEIIANYLLGDEKP